jgi:hypothetical protein
MWKILREMRAAMESLKCQAVDQLVACGID